jgi:hypothetical protein
MCRKGGDTEEHELPTRLLRHLVDCLRARKITVTELEAQRKTARFRGRLPFILGAFWGDRVVRATRHEWAMVRVASSDEAAALVSPERGVVTFPFRLVDQILRKEKENTLALIYNGIVAEPEEGMAPGAYQVLG